MVFISLPSHLKMPSLYTVPLLGRENNVEAGRSFLLGCELHNRELVLNGNRLELERRAQHKERKPKTFLKNGYSLVRSAR